MSEDYAKEKLYMTVLSLVTGVDDIKERLWNAAGSQMFGISREQDLPQRLQHEFESIRRDLTTEKPEGDEGTIKATVRKMSDGDASKIAERIFNLYMALLNTEPL